MHQVSISASLGGCLEVVGFREGGIVGAVGRESRGSGALAMVGAEGRRELGGEGSGGAG